MNTSPEPSSPVWVYICLHGALQAKGTHQWALILSPVRLPATNVLVRSYQLIDDREPDADPVGQPNWITRNRDMVDLDKSEDLLGCVYVNMSIPGVEALDQVLQPAPAVETVPDGELSLLVHSTLFCAVKSEGYFVGWLVPPWCVWRFPRSSVDLAQAGWNSGIWVIRRLFDLDEYGYLDVPLRNYMGFNRRILWLRNRLVQRRVAMGEKMPGSANVVTMEGEYVRPSFSVCLC